MEKDFTFRSIGSIVSKAQYHYEAPRQAVFAPEGAFLRWHKPIYAQAAADLTGFDRIWLIWVFDQNKHSNWKVKTRVPVPAERDSYSVFATRSPYRPNPVGISAVELVDITPEGLLLGPCDLLDGTAVLDVKPYIPQVDAFPDSQAGWRDRVEQSPWSIEWMPEAASQADFLTERGAVDLKNFCAVQLAYRPTDATRKRLVKLPENGHWQLHCRTWKIIFELLEPEKLIIVKKVLSNYAISELAEDASDIYQDKALHREFIKFFGG